jgi:1,2-dihydroxy-3-keto-5-methylthiopentene dioxygenase
MSHLTVYPENDPKNAVLTTSDFGEIKNALGDAGILLERWNAKTAVDDATDNETILAAYKKEIDELVAERGYQSYDVVSMHPEHPDKEAFRQKFRTAAFLRLDHLIDFL